MQVTYHWVGDFTAVFLELDTPCGILMEKEIYGLREIFRNVEYIVGCLANLPEKKLYGCEDLMPRDISAFTEFES